MSPGLAPSVEAWGNFYIIVGSSETATRCPKQRESTASSHSAPARGESRTRRAERRYRGMR